MWLARSPKLQEIQPKKLHFPQGREQAAVEGHTLEDMEQSSPFPTAPAAPRQGRR